MEIGSAHIVETASADAEARTAALGHLVEALEALPDGLAVFDPQDRLLSINDPYRGMLSAVADLVDVGVQYETLMRAFIARGAFRPETDDVEAWVVERLSLRRAGALRPMEYQLQDGRWIRAIDRRGSDGSYVNVRIDISERRRDQARLREALERAEAASKAKSLFLATMSHEIRTPLNGMLGAAQLLRKSALDAETSALVEALNDSGEALLAIVNDVLDVSKIEAGRLTLEEAPFQPEIIRRKLLATHRIAAENKGLNLHVVFHGEPTTPRMGDLHRIMQILNNLSSNAVKFTDVGTVEVGIDLRDPNRIGFTVRDNGCGMTEAQLARIFEDFVQADSSTTRRYGGTGLGMSIVKRLVEAMDGAIHVSSTPGLGTCISAAITAPVVAPDERPRADRSAAAGLTTGLRVLAVDDNEINRLVVEGLLRDLGCAPVLAASGMDALAAVATATFDVVLMDISMPEMDGVETLRALRKLYPNMTAPVIAVTANVLPDLIKSYLDEGFAGHLGKPIKQDELRMALAAHT
jgi:signal transduction histidine kinase